MSEQKEQQIYDPWFPMESLPSALYSEAIYDDHKGFRLFLQGENKNEGYLKVAFDSEFAYRKVDEGDFLNTVGNLSKQSFFYISKQSEFLTWFHRESCETKRGLGVCEYLIVTASDCISVLALSPPTITWVTDVS